MKYMALLLVLCVTLSGADRIVVIAHGRVVADETPDALRAQTGEPNLEDAFVKIIGSDEGLAA